MNHTFKARKIIISNILQVQIFTRFIFNQANHVFGKHMRKLKKLIKQPGPFFRDFLNKRYPVVNNEQMIKEEEENIVIQNSFLLLKQDSLILSQALDVDVVFTWVNNKDIEWQRKYKEFSDKHPPSSIGLHANDNARFCNHNELFYSVYSVKQYLPWVRNIFIVTDNQIPECIDLSDPSIKLIDHKEIIDSKFLPTFNSHVIEAHLHNIPGLSENFIYFNDDVFVARELMVQHFFRSNGIASIFVSNKSLNAMHKKGTNTPTLAASQNCIHLLQKYYQIKIDTPLVHTYVPLKKSAYQKAWGLFRQEIQEFLPNKLRTNQDLNLATFLIPWLMYLEGKAVTTQEICYYFNIRSANAPAQYLKLLSKNKKGQQPHSFCANDFNSKQQIPNYQNKLLSMLESYYGI